MQSGSLYLEDLEGFFSWGLFLKEMRLRRGARMPPYFHTLYWFDIGLDAVRYMMIAESKARTDPSPRAAVQPNHMAT